MCAVHIGVHIFILLFTYLDNLKSLLVRPITTALYEDSYELTKLRRTRLYETRTKTRTKFSGGGRPPKNFSASL